MRALKRKSTEGSTFISALAFSSLLFIVSAGFLLMTSSEYKLNHRSYRSAVAINLAEAGVDYAVHTLNSDDISSWSGTNPRTKSLYALETVGEGLMGDVSMAVFDPTGTNPIVESTSYVPNMSASENVSRTVRVRLGPRTYRPFSDAFSGGEFVKLAGNSYTDSYDSALGEYGGDNVGSNGDVTTSASGSIVIEVDGGSIINGDAVTGPGGIIVGEDNITGDIRHDSFRELPPVEVPADLASQGYWDGFGLLSLTGSSTYTLEPGNYKFKRIKLTANAKLTINGPAKIYITGYYGKSILQTGGGSELICNGNVQFYVDDRVTCAGNGITNSGCNPSDFVIFGTSTADDFDFSGSSAFYGAVYAPNAQINLNGSDDGYGSFVGRRVISTGGRGYHYDEALEAMEISFSGYELTYWQEKG